MGHDNEVLATADSTQVILFTFAVLAVVSPGLLVAADAPFKRAGLIVG